ncbi:hypothetical protein G6F23_015419 [Rhizopus arrhizus]|nr:hypothetical protein G6F23_015419 [Rhizopus arrhizus]
MPGQCDLRRRRRAARPTEFHRAERRTLSRVRQHQPRQEAPAGRRRLERQAGQAAIPGKIIRDGRLPHGGRHRAMPR